MKLKITLLLAAVVGLFALAYAAVPTPTPATKIEHEIVTAAFAKGGVTMLATNNYKVMAGRRSAPGEVEVHDYDTDVFYVLDGTATFVTGGQVAEGNVTSPGEIRGKAITGGVTNKLVKGDVIVIPNGTPHWFTQASDPFLYFVVKVSK